MWGCLVVLLAVGCVGHLLAVPVTVFDLMAAQTPPQRPDWSVWAAGGAVSVLTALAVAASAGRRRPARWPALLLRTLALLALCTAVTLWIRDAVGTGNWTLGSTLESLGAGVTALLFRGAVRRWERGRPMAGEVWLALVPFRDRDEEAQHYCVVLRRRYGHAEVLQITSRNKDARADFIRMPNDGWDVVSGRDHWLEIGLPPRRVPYRKFLKDTPQGPCPRATWRQVRRPRPAAARG
ncbi:hypothetical protein [Allostreptomyces psammosilenae]|uniref:Uncharacterized protein n=1 Tax=Allostreptomyces psammosilenae TaxID=1892865 RepID=A0A853A1M1_9ACTN|nr:hypothetical protein [Allostreptomyces psammosilenae]NYI04691.1 hypothetical protein [Allostreptomyces psammosilenae]